MKEWQINEKIKMIEGYIIKNMALSEQLKIIKKTGNNDSIEAITLEKSKVTMEINKLKKQLGDAGVDADVMLHESGAIRDVHHNKNIRVKELKVELNNAKNKIEAYKNKSIKQKLKLSAIIGNINDGLIEPDELQQELESLLNLMY